MPVDYAAVHQQIENAKRASFPLNPSRVGDAIVFTRPGIGAAAFKVTVYPNWKLPPSCTCAAFKQVGKIDTESNMCPHIMYVLLSYPSAQNPEFACQLLEMFL